MRLLLLRHGEASQVAESDALRPLTPNGREGVVAALERYLAWRSRMAVPARDPATLLASPFLRAQQSLNITEETLQAAHQPSLQPSLKNTLQPALKKAPATFAAGATEVGWALFGPAVSVDPVAKHWLTPSTPPLDCLQELARLEEAGVEELWLVAHNPLLSELLGLLVDADRYSQPSLSTAELVELDCEPLAIGCASVEYRA